MNGRFLRAVVTALLIGVAAAAVLLVVAQQPFPPSRFDFGQPVEYRGIFHESPYPTLLSDGRQFLLVASGKRGAAEDTRGFDGAAVSMKGMRIERDGHVMLELVPESLVRLSEPAPPRPSIIDEGDVTLTGEIVDSKCFLGVMNPGNGKVHRDCAARCISGGVPPALLVRDAAGKSRVFLLTLPDGRPVGKQILNYVAEPIRIRGRAHREGSLRFLASDPTTFRHPE